jgi:hypothetical protein
MMYTVLYRSSDAAPWEEWKITYPSRCIAEMKVAEIEERGRQAKLVLTAELIRLARPA